MCHVTYPLTHQWGASSRHPRPPQQALISKASLIPDPELAEAFLIFCAQPSHVGRCVNAVTNGDCLITAADSVPSTAASPYSSPRRRA